VIDLAEGAIDDLRSRCVGVCLDDRDAAQRRRAAYIAVLADEAAAWWQHVRAEYTDRHRTMMCVAGAAALAGDEPRYQRYARRAWRWGKIIRRLDARDGEWLLRAYQRVRTRPDVMRLVAAALPRRWGVR
jgi:hypothetical protein